MFIQTFKKYLFIGSLYLISYSSAFAGVAVISGNGQVVPAGESSASIIFQVTDAVGNPNTSASLNFTLVNEANVFMSSELSITQAGVNSQAQAATKVNSTLNQLGSYIITATLVGDSSQKANASLTITTGLPANLEVISGDNQSIVTDATSEPMSFKLVDMFGNPITGKTVNFIAQEPATMDSTLAGLAHISATTNDEGVVETQYTTSQKVGVHTVTATLADNLDIVKTIQIVVTQAPPTLPSLGAAGGVNKDGWPVLVDASFAGGISVNGADFVTKVTQNLSDEVIVRGVITPDEDHIGKQVDFIVVAGYVPPAPNDNVQLFYMLDEDMNVLQWDMSIATLAAREINVTLQNPYEVTMYTGKFIAGGILRVFFGYRLDSGLVVFNAETPIEIEILE